MIRLTLTVLLAALLTAPALAEEPAATQPAPAPEAAATQPAEETPATQPATTQPARKKYEPEQRKRLPVTVRIDKAEDVWKLLPFELRPPPNGKITDELADKIEAWVKANGDKIEDRIQFTGGREVCSTAVTNKFEYRPKRTFKTSDEKLTVNVVIELNDMKDAKLIGKAGVTGTAPDKSYEFTMSSKVSKLTFSRDGKGKYTLAVRGDENGKLDSSRLVTVPPAF